MRPVNLLPEHLRPRERSGNAGGAYIILGVLGLLLLGTLAYVVTANEVTSRQAETERLAAETRAADARAGALAGFGDFRSVKEVRVASVKTLAAGRFDWERMSRELARVLPSGVWLTELKATATGEEAASASSGSSSSGSSSSSSSSSADSGEEESQPRLTMIGCASTQEAVAETMVRLRRVHQAQEVTLARSERPAQETTAGAGSAAEPAEDSGEAAAPAAEAGGCGAKRGRANYEFEVKVVLSPSATPPVGGDDVPSSLGGGA